MANTVNIWDDKLRKYIPIHSLRGKSGKSAYEYAVEGGYTGTEEEFAERMNFPISIHSAAADIGLNRYLEAYCMHKKFDVIIPDTVEVIEEYKFYEMTWDMEDKLVRIGTLFIPTSVKNIKNSCFNSLKVDRIVIGAETIGEGSFSYIYTDNLTLSEGVKRIGNYSISGIIGLTNLTIPSTVEEFEVYTINSNNDLRTVIFKGTPSVINAEYPPFFGCPNLTTIKVPWSEGEVAGAPWGATNATFIYNYTEEGDENG